MNNYPSAVHLRDVLAARRVVGPFCKTCDPAVIEALGLGGFDFVILDMEHGPCGLETVGHLIRAAEAAGAAPIVRVRSCDDARIGMALDLGAAGVQVPQVRSAEDLAAARMRARFAPDGERGVCKYVRAAGYASTPPADYFASGGRPLLIAQVEAAQAVDNLGAILDTGACDILFVGPYDLSQSLGVTGKVDHPKVLGALEGIVRACLKRGVHVGTFVDTVDQAKRWADLGVSYLCLSVDMGIIRDAARGLIRAVMPAGGHT